MNKSAFVALGPQKTSQRPQKDPIYIQKIPPDTIIIKILRHILLINFPLLSDEARWE